jgi:cysteine desulfurase
MRQVYLDYSATTPVKEEVLKAMIPYFTENFGNPSSLYTKGAISKEAITNARKQVSSLIGAGENEIFFTSSGTEADDWAIIGVAEALKSKGNHIITTGIEHHAVLRSCEYLAKNGFEITYLNVDKQGKVNPEDLEKAITEKTILISIMYVNNEIGIIQDIKELSGIAKLKNITFHTDAVQALGNVNFNVKDLGVDLMSISSHKIYGPKGVGALYIKKGTRISNFMHGGSQENKRRAGTENLTGIIGFGKAAEISGANMDEHIAKVTELRNYFIDEVFDKIDDAFLNGSREFRHPGNANITFEYIEGEAMLLYLDALGISVSTGSACSSESLTPSHVLTCLGVPVEKIHGSLRFTIGDPTTKEEIDYTVEKLVEVVAKLRAISSVSKVKGW